MRIGVTIGALVKRNAYVPWPAIARRSMTFLACDLGVQSGQRVAGFRMVQLADADRFPVVVVVALQTIGTEASLVLVFMTR